MPSFPTGKQVYDRIRWDSALEPIWFTIGVLERESESGIAEISYEAFEPDGDIPWHRIRYFRVGAYLVWDRAARVDRLAELREVALSADEEFSLPAR